MEIKERESHGNFNGAFSSRHINIDLNKLPFEFDLNELLPSEFEHEEPQSLVVVDHNNISKNPPNPSCETCPSSNKRQRISERLKKAKKLKTEEVVLEDGERSPPPTPEWLLEVMIDKAEDVRLIFKKSLTESDVSPSQSRILIPFNELLRNDFLTHMESNYLKQEKDKDGKKPGLKVMLVNQRSEKWSLLFKRIVMKKKKKTKKNESENATLNYVLNHGWNKVVECNGLKVNDKICLWSFRSEGILCFAFSVNKAVLNV